MSKVVKLPKSIEGYEYALLLQQLELDKLTGLLASVAANQFGVMFVNLKEHALKYYYMVGIGGEDICITPTVIEEDGT